MVVLLAIFVVSVYVGYRAKYEHKIKIKWLRVIIDVIIVSFLIPVCVNLMMPFFQKDEREKRERVDRKILSAITQSKLNDKDLEDLISYQYREIFESSQGDAKRWARELIDSMLEKKEKLGVLAEHTEEIVQKLRFKWWPLHMYALDQFDKRINELQKHNPSIKIELAIDKYDLILDIDSITYRTFDVRKVVFPNGNLITIKFEPASIQRGVLIEGTELNFTENLKFAGLSYAFSIACNEKIIQINPRNNRYSDIDIRTEDDPLMVDDFKDTLAKGINKLITSAYLHE